MAKPIQNMTKAEQISTCLCFVESGWRTRHIAYGRLSSIGRFQDRRRKTSYNQSLLDAARPELSKVIFKHEKYI